MKKKLQQDLYNLGIKKGDTILIRGSLGSIGKSYIKGIDFIQSLIDAVGEDGTIISLSFTKSSTIFPAKRENYFHEKTPTYAGAIPQNMLSREDSVRSKHPMCSFVAIGKHAKYILDGHDENAPAYSPMEKMIELGAKGVLIGCVKSSPGFTTAHLAEYKIGLHKLVIFPQLTSAYYKDNSNQFTLFRRKDLGLCSQSYYKFYSHYVNAGILQTGYVGSAYSILVPLKEAYQIEYDLMKHDRLFNICENPICVACNARRWDRLYKWPSFIYNKLKQIISRSS